MTAETTEPTPSAPGIPAATAIIFRRGSDAGAPEIMLLQRTAAMRFAGGAIVFPGGRLDAADYALAGAADPSLELADAAARVAAIRETLEETGLVIGVNEPVTSAEARAARALAFEQGTLAAVLDRFGWTLRLDKLLPYARWCPRMEPAFDTRFYLTDLGTGAVDVMEDGTENAAIFWSTAANALDLVDQGKLAALFPTQCNLHRLARYGSFAEAQADAAAFPPRLLCPTIDKIDGVIHLSIPEDVGYPFNRLVITPETRRT